MVCNKNPAPPYIEMGQATKTRYPPYIEMGQATKTRYPPYIIKKTL